MKTPKHHMALCVGSFDPPSLGHFNIIERSLKIFDRVVVGIAKNYSKSTLFSIEERENLLKDIFKNEPRVEVACFEGLLVAYAKERGIKTLIRGIRTVEDYQYEFQMSLINKSLDPDMETLFMMTEGSLSHVSSSMIKEVVELGGSVTHMVHPLVEAKLKEKLIKRQTL